MIVKLILYLVHKITHLVHVGALKEALKQAEADRDQLFEELQKQREEQKEMIEQQKLLLEEMKQHNDAHEKVYSSLA